MTKTSKYIRCKKCKELVVDAENCANCSEMNPLSYGPRSSCGIGGKRGTPTLDIQEGNNGFWGDD